MTSSRKRARRLAPIALALCFGCTSPEGPEPDGGARDASPGPSDASTARDAAPDGSAALDAAPAAGPCAIVAAADGAGEACTELAPCSLAAAQASARVRAAAGLSEDLVVCLRGGTYALDAPLTLGPEDSGSNGHAVVYRSSPGERAVLSGGTPISGFRLFDAERGIWRAPAPPGLRTRQLIVDDARAFRTRGPFRPAGFVQSETGYTAPNTALASFRNPSDLELVSFLRWRSYRCGVSGVSGLEVTIDPECWALAHLFNARHYIQLPTWFENAYEYLGTPGFFYHDRAEGFVYYVPREGEDLDRVIAPTLEQIVVIRGAEGAPAHDLALEGMTFAHSTWLGIEAPGGYPVWQSGAYWTGTPDARAAALVPGAVTIERATDIRLAGDVFEHLGASGLALETGSKRVLVEGNVIRDTSGAGIRIGNVDAMPADDAVVEDVTVRNNLVTQVGRELFDNPAILIGYARRTQADHNEIHDVYYTGISLGWGWSRTPTIAGENRISRNLISNVMRWLDDGGAVYTLSTQPGSVIERNYLHGVFGDFAGLYFDQGSEHYVASENVVASAPNWTLLQPGVMPYAQLITLTGNYSDTDVRYCCGPSGCCTDADRMNVFTDNTVFAPGAWPAEAATIMTEAGLEPEHLGLRPRELVVEAEDFMRGGEGVGYHELTPENRGAASRATYRGGEAVDVYTSWGASSYHVVGFTQTGEWTRYLVDVRDGGTHALVFRTSAESDGNAIDVEIDGTPAGSVSLPNTRSYATYTSATLEGVGLPAGPHLVQLSFTGGFNLDYFRVEPR